MAYIDYSYYTDVFGGNIIPQYEFDALARAASDIVDAIITTPITDEIITDNVKRAVCYQAEFMYAHGGYLFSVTSGSISSEHLGDYSITEGDSNGGKISYNGLSISPLTVALLRKAGLLSRWLYAGVYNNANTQ